MTASWDSFNRRVQRIRGGEIPLPHPVAWRHQRRAEAPRRPPSREALAEARDPMPATGFKIGPLYIDLDGVFAFALVTPMLFIANLGTLGGAMVAALTPIYLWVRRKQLGRVLLTRAGLYAFAAYCLFSVIWSEAPKDSLKTAIEYGLTITVGIVLSSARNQQAVVRGLAVAFLVYIADAVITGGTVAIGVGSGGSAFSGLTSSKNLLADIASTGLIVSFAMMLMAVRDRKWPWIGIGALAILIDLYAVVAARSAGAMMGLGIGLAAMLGLLPLLAAGRAVRASLTALLAFFAILFAFSYRWLSQALIEFSANLFDKDPTLTGRTYLWYRAADLIREKPLLGRGYQAFWIQGNIDAEGLWRYFGIDTRGGFTFHNTVVGTTVTLGAIGLVIFFATLAIGAVALIRKFVVRPSLSMCFWIAILLYQVSRMGIEEIGTAPFYFSTALLFGALGSAFGRVRVAQAAHQPIRQAPRLVQVWPVDYRDAGWANPRLTPVRGSLRVLHSDVP
jgi:exopolysaccharide production protein ExoQ